MFHYPRRFINARRPWLYEREAGRRDNIVGVMLHSTRSGHTDGDDGPGTENYGNSMYNVGERDAAGNPLWGGYWDELIWEDGTQIQSTYRDYEAPRWCAGYGNNGTWDAGRHYIQIELAQGTKDEPFQPECIDSAAQLVAALSIEYNFPLERIEFLTQRGVPPPGIATHELSANGKKLGKSDVGPMFPWALFLSLATKYRKELLGEPDMTPAEVEEITRKVIEEEKRWSRLIDSGSIPELMAQIVGVRENTYTGAEDLQLIAEIREALDIEVSP